MTGPGICGAFGIDANGTQICSPGTKVSGSMKLGSQFRTGIWFVRGEAAWNVSCTLSCSIKAGLDVRGAEDDDSRDLINAILNGTMTERIVDLKREMSVTSLNAVSLINTTDDELRYYCFDLLSGTLHINDKLSADPAQ